MEKYDGPRLVEGCIEFDKIIIQNFPSIRAEFDKVTNIDAEAFGVRTMVILQKIMREGKDIIYSEGQNRYLFINDALLRQQKIHHLQHKLSRKEVLHQWSLLQMLKSQLFQVVDNNQQNGLHQQKTKSQIQGVD